MPKPKFDRGELGELISKEVPIKDIASKFGVSPQAIQKAAQKMGLAITRHVATRGVPEKLVAHNLNAFEQLKKINDNANELLDLWMAWQRGDDVALRILESQVKKVIVGKGEDAHEVLEFKFKDPRELALKTMEVIRGQL